MASRRTSLLKLLRSIIRNPPYLEMGKVYQTYLSSDRVYTCTTCHTHLARHEDIISKVSIYMFFCDGYNVLRVRVLLTPYDYLPCLPGLPRSARSRVPLQRSTMYTCFRANITLGAQEDRLLMTGLHSVADIFCNVCQTTVGWKYNLSESRTSATFLTSPHAFRPGLRLRGVPEVQGRQVHRREGQDVQRELLGGRRWGGDGRAMSDVDAGEMIGILSEHSHARALLITMTSLISRDVSAMTRPECRCRVAVLSYGPDLPRYAHHHFKPGNKGSVPRASPTFSDRFKITAHRRAATLNFHLAYNPPPPFQITSHIMLGNFSAPVEHGITVLDAGCGSGKWCLEWRTIFRIRHS
ncbi:hypothetical protein BC936DRAFT_138662 [Jimgerdemannia flammicorona]|uniref:Yippee domain-containing protein n=1 Tax=Jimgerdemannia flammicorona TaxID=994334 RepID=A0A433BUT5_9FUNG|nr:hypothetical protein BC936DRAFT_138662 [Jimgerdemannia flammicorona]